MRKLFLSSFFIMADTADVFMFRLCRFAYREIWYDSAGYKCGQSL